MADVKAESNAQEPNRPDRLPGLPNADGPEESGADLRDPRVVLSLLEADQVVAAKARTHFGRRELSRGVRALLWGLRIYVVIIMVIVLISVIHAFHAP